MAKEILKDELLNEEQLDQVAGGTLRETYEDMDRFTDRTGYNFHGDFDKFRDMLYRCGIKIKDHGGSHENEYYLLDDKGKVRYEVNRNDAINYAIGNYRSGKFLW